MVLAVDVGVVLVFVFSPKQNLNLVYSHAPLTKIQKI